MRILTVKTLQLADTIGIEERLEEDHLEVKSLWSIGSVRRRALWSPAFPLALRNEILYRRPDIIHSQGIWRIENHCAVCTARSAGIPVVISPRGTISDYSLRQKGRKKELAWKLYQKRDMASAALFHATADSEAEELRRLGFRAPIAVLANGVDLPEKKQSKRHGQKSHRTLLFMSRIHPKKGLEMLIDAWSGIDTSGWKCLIAGPDREGHQNALQNKIDQMGLSADFEFPGMIQGDRKWEMIENADLFILPTHSENFGVVVAEAIGMGIPTITTRGAPWQALTEHRCGWWTEISTEGIATALRKAMSLTDAERDEMGQRGKRYIEEHYSWPGIAQEMERVYRWILGDGPKPSCVES